MTESPAITTILQATRDDGLQQCTHHKAPRSGGIHGQLGRDRAADITAGSAIGAVNTPQIQCQHIQTPALATDAAPMAH